MRDMFKNTKKEAPAIDFLDGLESVADDLLKQETLKNRESDQILTSSDQSDSA